MGTRNLTCVLSDGKIKLAQYCQWDGYPTGQGQTIAEFILNVFDKRKFKKQLGKIRFLKREETQALWEACGAEPGRDTVTMEVSDRFKKKHPQLSRDTGAEVLEYIQTTEKPELCANMGNDINFAADSLMCEWVYVLNLDTNTLEIFKGFNKEKLKRGERFYSLQNKVKKEGPYAKEYFPVKLWKKVPFKKLTLTIMGELEMADREEEEKAI